MGPIEGNLIRQSRQAKTPLPDRIKNKPRLKPGLALFLDAFYDLEHDRQWVSGGERFMPLPIPWLTMHTYAQAHNFTGEMYDDLIYFVGELDTAYLKHLNEKMRTSNRGDITKPSKAARKGRR